MFVHSWQVGNGGTLAYHYGQVVHALKPAKQLLKDELNHKIYKASQARPGLLAYQTQISLNVKFYINSLERCLILAPNLY